MELEVERSARNLGDDLEACLLLYGNDMSDDTTPLEAGLAWTTKLKLSMSFNGRKKLEEQKAGGIPRRLVGLQVIGKGIIRHGYKVFDGEVQVGEVTSGSHSPTLGKGIGLAYVKSGHHKKGTKLSVEVRGKPVPVEIVKKPFYKRPVANSVFTWNIMPIPAEMVPAF